MPNDGRSKHVARAPAATPPRRAQRNAFMSAERGRGEYSLSAQRTGWGLRPPVWYLRLRLRRACEAIERLQRELANEFGVVETAPVHRELEALLAERDSLHKRLAARS